MNQRIIKALSRRASLLTLSTAGLTAALASPLATSAKKKHGKKRGKQLKSDALCKKQVGQCVDFFTPACMGNPECLAVVDRCCPSMGTCQLDGFLDCVSQTSVETRLAPISTP